MSIERREIEKLATLSRIAINEETISEVSQRFGSVLELVDQLQAVNTDGVEAMSHPMQATQRLREDEVTELNQTRSPAGHSARNRRRPIFSAQSHRISGPIMHNLTIAELVKGLQSKEFTSVELTQHFLDRIASLDPAYNAVITVTAEQALQAAAAADQRLAAGNAPDLCGVPILHKDIFCTDGVRTSCGSKMLDNFIPPYNATVVENFEQAGAVVLGKTNMDEFAMGSSNETSFYGPVKNPWATDSVPGGSSGGLRSCSCSATGTRRHATDTGGSIRQPAALCGVSGIKPTYGRVSRWGMIAFASSLDQGGPMARTAEDCALLLNCMASYDDKDSTCIDREVPDYTATLNSSVKGLRIGVPKEYFSEGLHPGTEEAVRAALADLEARAQSWLKSACPTRLISTRLLCNRTSRSLGQPVSL